MNDPSKYDPSKYMNGNINNNQQSINIPTNVISPNSNMDNAQIFSQQDVIAYLERKGLSVDTIKRLQIYNNNGTGNNINNNNTNNHNRKSHNNNHNFQQQSHSTKHQNRKKSAHHKKHQHQQFNPHQHQQELKYVSLSNNKYVLQKKVYILNTVKIHTKNIVIFNDYYTDYLRL